MTTANPDLLPACRHSQPVTSRGPGRPRKYPKVIMARKKSASTVYSGFWTRDQLKEMGRNALRGLIHAHPDKARDLMRQRRQAVMHRMDGYDYNATHDELYDEREWK